MTYSPCANSITILLHGDVSLLHGNPNLHHRLLSSNQPHLQRLEDEKMASGSRKPLSEFARFQYNFETSFMADALLDPILSQLPLHGLETDCIDPGVLAHIDPSKHTWKNFPREMLLLGDDMKEWMEEDGQAEKENILHQCNY